MSVSKPCNFHADFLRNPEIEQEGKEWVKTEQGNCLFVSHAQLSRELAVVLQSCPSY